MSQLVSRRSDIPMILSCGGKNKKSGISSRAEKQLCGKTDVTRILLIQGSCGKFDKISNGISYNFIGLMEWELQLFYCAAIFHPARNSSFLVLAHTQESHWDVRTS